MAKSVQYNIGGRCILVERIGNEYAVLTEDGKVYGHRTTTDIEEATRIALAICNGRTPEWRPVGKVA